MSMGLTSAYLTTLAADDRVADLASPGSGVHLKGGGQ